MNEQAEKLVEEVAGYLLGAYELGHQDGTANDGRSQLTTKFLGHLSKELITRIGKAFRDGELDEVLGVLGRQPWYGEKLTDEIAEMWLYWLSLMMAGGAKTFIALSPIVHDPEAGTEESN